MASKLPLSWTIHLRDPERKEKFEAAVLNSSVAIDRLRDILEARLEAIEAEEISDNFLKEWNLEQRFYKNLGRKAELKDLLRLLTFNGAKTSG